MARKSLKGNAMILMAAGFGVKLIGFFYRIYLANLIGAEGMGLFHLIMPLYSLVILTMTSGVSIAVSRIIAQESAKKNHINSVRVGIVSCIFVFVGSSIVSFLLFLNTNFIVNHIVNEPRTMQSLVFLFPSIPFIAAASAIKGYFYGKQDVVPPAISQIVEQLAKLTLTLVIASYFMDRGMEYFCLLATIGMIFGEFANLVVVGIIFRKNQKRIRKRAGEKVMRKREIAGSILKIAVPISINKLVSSLMGAAENILIPQMLLLYGLSALDSLEQYGRLTGMAFPLLFFPSMITMALATTLVPAISEAISKRKYQTANYQISRSIQLTLVLGFIFTTIFMCCGNQIGELIYKGQEVGQVIYLLSFTCIFIYLLQTLVGILSGLGKEKITLWNSLLGNTIRIGFVIFGIPAWGLKAYILGIIVSCMVVSILNFTVVIRTSGMALDFRNWFVKPLIASLLVIFSSKYISFMVLNFIKIDTIASMVNIMVICGMSVAMMFVVGVYNFKDILELIPLGRLSKLARQR